MQLRKALRSRLPYPVTLRKHRGDALAVFALFALTVVAAWGLLTGGTAVGMDAATQYYPWYSFLGESLRSVDIPGWNPHQFSGTPFAADPLSGWGYLPAMLLFTFLPLVAAVESYLFFHLLLAGLSLYAFARSLGIGTLGALLAAVAYEHGSYLYLSIVCCSPHAVVMAWLPLVLLGVEMAIRDPRLPARVLWWGTSGFALSQILASWLGHGSYYALLALAGYIAYRTLIYPPGYNPGIKDRLLASMLHGGVVLAFGFGLAAASVLPRLEFNALSNLAGGYPGGDLYEGGWAVQDYVSLLAPGAYWYAGAAVLALALAAPFAARGFYAVPYFVALVLGALTLSGQGPTLLHSALYLLPRFGQIHPHYPERVVVILYLGIALLAGVTLSRLAQLGKKERFVAFLPALAALFLIFQIPSGGTTAGAEGPGGWAAQSPFLTDIGIAIPPAPLLALILSGVLAAAYALLPARFAAWRRRASVLLILVVFVDLSAAGSAAIDEQGLSAAPGSKEAEQAYAIGHIDLAEHYRPSDAARFLQSRGEEGPFRYFGFGPGYADPGTFSTVVRFTHPNVRALEMNNRATLQGLENIQGYNAVRIARYDEYVNAMNGKLIQQKNEERREQEEDEGPEPRYKELEQKNGEFYEQNYHFADVLRGGTVSPLLDLLGARYMIVPALTPPENQAGLDYAVYTRHPVVYQDEQTKVLENREALPRAWIVHSARQVEPGEALELLDTGEVDPKETALLEEEFPGEISQPDDPSADEASLTEYEADRIQLKTTTGAPGLLVLGEVYYPAWKAYVDGEPAPVYPTDHLLRSVPIPAGEHTVELRYESWTLRAGVAISLATGASLAVLAVAAAVARRRQKRAGGEEIT